MSVLENKLVPVDYDGSGTYDLAFWTPFPDPVDLNIDGQFGIWLLDGAPTAQAELNDPYELLLPIPISTPFGPVVQQEGFFTGFGTAPTTVLDTLPAPLVGLLPGPIAALLDTINTGLGTPKPAPDFNGDGNTVLIFLTPFIGTSPATSGLSIATWWLDGTDITAQAFITDSSGATAVVGLEYVPSVVRTFTSDFNGIFPATTAPVGGQGTLADFNGDGTTDILFVSALTGDIAVWLIDDAVAVTQAVIGNPGDFTLVNTNDFDGNGTTDLLFTESVEANTINVAIWTLDSTGTGFTAQAVIGEATDNFQVVDTNDFNGDGTADILFIAPSASIIPNDPTTFGFDIAVWTLDGTTVTGQAIVGTATDGFFLVDHNDFNGDGKADLLFAQPGQTAETQGEVTYAVWLQDGTTTLAQYEIGTASADFAYSSSGDTNGDGTADLVFYSDTEVATWTFGTNGQLSSQSVIGTYTAGIPDDLYQPPFEQISPVQAAV